MRRYIRKIKLEWKIYAVLLIAVVGVFVWWVLTSGWLQPKTFDETIFDPKDCLIDKNAFDYDAVTRKDIKDVEDVMTLFPVLFEKGNKGNGKYGVIDADGAVVIEPLFDQITGIYGGIMRTIDSNQQITFYDLNLNELEMRAAARDFYEAKRLYDLALQGDVQNLMTLRSRSSLDKDMVNAIEAEVKLEIYYLSFFRLPVPYYTLRMHSSAYDRVFVVLDENLKMLNDDYFMEPIYFGRNGIAKVVRPCAIAYINTQGEYIWFHD